MGLLLMIESDIANESASLIEAIVVVTGLGGGDGVSIGRLG